jgi:hypothetical protein
MPIDTTIAETVLNNRETVTNIRRFAIGALMAASIPLGIPAIIATGAFCVGLNSAAFSMETRMREKKLVDFYKDEIAAFLNKSPDAITMDDLRQAAKPVEQGGKNIIILQNELNEQKTNQKFRFLNSVASSLVTTGALVGLSACCLALA